MPYLCHPSPAALAFDALAGDWALTRRSESDEILFEGVACCRRVSEFRARLEERGFQRAGAGRWFAAWRTYLYTLLPAESFVLIHACDPDNAERELHRLQFERTVRGLCATHTHRCAQDSYALEIVVRPEGIATVYRVWGPSKNYVLRSTYRRAGDGSSS